MDYAILSSTIYLALGGSSSPWTSISIDFELADQTTRGEKTHPRSRIVPSSIDYLEHQKVTGALPSNAQYPTYTRYLMAEKQWASAALVTGDKEWHGHPLVVIRMAWRDLGAVRNGAVPATIRQKLAFLLDLYRIPFNQPVEILGPRPPSPRPPRSPSPDGDGNGKGRGGKERKRKRKNSAALSDVYHRLSNKLWQGKGQGRILL